MALPSAAGALVLASLFVTLDDAQASSTHANATTAGSERTTIPRRGWSWRRRRRRPRDASPSGLRPRSPGRCRTRSSNSFTLRASATLAYTSSRWTHEG